MGQLKIFTLNDQVVLNQDGAIVAPFLVGKVGLVTSIVKDEGKDVYTIEFDGGTKGDFFGDELDHFEYSEKPAGFDFEATATKIGKLVTEKQKAYGNAIDTSYEVMKAFLTRYKGADGSYTIPEEVLRHMLLMVRIFDKQNRIFSNPKGDLMQESPFMDIIGYGLLGLKMVEEMK